MAKSLWVIPDIKGKRTPYSILSEQADALRGSTDGLLVGFVDRASHEGKFLSTLKISVPQLGNYTFSVITVEHDINLFPVRVFSQFDGNPFTYADPNNLMNDEAALEAYLEKVLTSTEMQKAIGSLLAQVRGS